MKVLVTGAKGFIGLNLIAILNNLRHESNLSDGLEIEEIFLYDVENTAADLQTMTKDCDFVFHLAGVNRPESPDEFMKGNFGFTSELLKSLEANGNKCPVMISSSIQAAQQNEYGKSKLAGEEIIFDYGIKTGAKVLAYRFPNVFGKWSKPNYNSAVATFCHNISRGLPITVNDPEIEMNLVYIDDLVAEMVLALRGKENKLGKHCFVPVTYTAKLGQIVELLYSFAEGRTELTIPNLDDDFVRKLYATYISFLPQDCFSYPLRMNVDGRGSFTEFLRTKNNGQVSINVIRPSVVKGNHWHQTKHEKFLVVSGSGVIRFRHLITNEVVEYLVSDNRLEAVDIPPGYTHQIQNTGTSDLVVVMWVNEPFDAARPDTFFLEV